jgi:flagellar hook-associated protein 3 FlgL
MRVTQHMMANQVLGSISDSLARLAKVQEQLSSTKRINRASDDPLDSSLVMRLQARKAVLEGYQRTTDAAQSLLEATAVPLDRATELLQQAREIAIQGSSDTLQSGRGPLAEQVNQLLEDLLGQANTRFNDRYVFGGAHTDQPAFSASRDGQGRITAVAANPNGIDQPLYATVADGLQLQSSIPGDQPFQRTLDAFDSLVALRDALNANDTAGISAGIDSLKQGIEQLNTASGVVGVGIQRLDAMRTRTQQDLTRVEQLRSTAQDADVTQVYLEMQQMQTAFQASLAAGAKALQSSLLDFLR